MIVDLPTRILESNPIVYQYAQMLPVGVDVADVNYTTVGCKTFLGSTDPEQSVIENFEGKTIFNAKNPDIIGKSWAEQTVSERVDFNTFVKSSKEFSYVSGDSEIFDGNTQQICVVEMELWKANREADIARQLFQTYKVRLGARLYASDSSSSFKSLPDNKFKFKLENPSYDTTA